MATNKYKCYGSTSQPEYTLCGDAFDLCELDDSEAKTPRFAKPGQKVTCPSCQRQIKDILGKCYCEIHGAEEIEVGPRRVPEKRG